MTAQNAEAVCFTSFIILRCSIAMMQEQTADVAILLQWLKMGRGAAAVMWKAKAAIAPNMPTSLQFFLDSFNYVLTEQAQASDMDSPFEKVFTVILEARDDINASEAYHKALTYINKMQRCIDRGEPMYILGRRLQTFPMLIPGRFIDLFEESDPFALVVMAHFFGIAAQVDSKFWFLQGDEHNSETMASKEIRAIAAQVPGAARDLMAWPLMQLNSK